MAKAPTEIRSLARSHTDSALKVLASIMNKTDAPESARVAAANSLLDRGWGKPTQAHEHSGANGNPIELVNKIERVIVGASTQDAADTDTPGIPTAH